MKVINKNNNKFFNYNMMNKNIILINNVEISNDIFNVLSLIFNNKYSTSEYDIIMEKNDISIDKSVDKIIKIPTYFDFLKDICGGGKSILKELIILCLKYDAFSSSSITNLFSFINTIDLTEISLLDNLLNNLNQKTGLNFEYEIQDQIINYIAEQTIFKISSINSEENIINMCQSKLRKIYLELIKSIINIEDKNIHLLFVNPFNFLNYKEIVEYYNEISNISKYTIITDKFVYCDNINNSILKVWYDSNFLDFSNIYDNIKFYMNFSNLISENEFIEELKTNINKLISSYNNELIEINYPVFQYLINN
ncbi:hypothetical protein SLITO_v1c06270 [Spiroplasma litorale]|uniref:Uncharacterized protein n=1 Tax=Spiroplasma litorale TaxID=216942 RepID=A0A0K1W262_9MOLU|nr:hypothetical protein [Spiroplasma litorale]AKX34256.1 hypothetical protein SLITO_v1c06270 [Spiroplasma litorale]